MFISNMNILKFSLGQMQANCYFLIEGEECLIVDPADDAAFILEELQRRKLKLVGMIATHGHFDHVLAAGEIQMHVGNRYVCSFHINQNDKFLVDRLNETAEYFLGYNPHSLQPKEIKYLKEGKLDVGSWKLDVISTPGHTPGSVGYSFPKERIIFTGDTLFKGGIGRYDFSYSCKNDLKKSINNLFQLPKNTVIYSGHGEETTIWEEINFQNRNNLFTTNI